MLHLRPPCDRRPVASLLLVALLAAAPGVARAQPAGRDTLPFRAGQWAAQFGLGGFFESLGALRFTSPRSAWVMDLRVTHQSSAETERFVLTTGDTIRRTSRNFAVDAVGKLGWRRYRPVGDQIAGFFGAGLSGGGSRGRAHDFGHVQRQSSWNAGVFGELGASYLLTPQLSVGGGLTLGAAYTRQLRSDEEDHPDGLSSADDSRVFLATSSVAVLTLTIYF